jgi:hypothetical protein
MAERLIGDRRTSDSLPTDERNHPIPPPTKTYRPASPLLGSASGPRSQPACRSWANPDGMSGSKAARRPTPNSHQSVTKTSGSKLGCRHRGWLAMRSTAPTQAAGRAAGPPDRLCAGGRLPPPGPLGWHHLPGRGAAQAGPGQGVAGWVDWSGRQGPPPVRLGVYAPGPRWSSTSRPGRTPLTAGPLEPRHRRAGLLPLLHAWPNPAGGSGQGRRAALDHPRALPDRPGPMRPGPAPGPPLALLVPLDDLGHGCPRLPGRCRAWSSLAALPRHPS